MAADRSLPARHRTIGPRSGGPRPEGDEPARRVLSTVEVDVVWEALGLGPTPVVLDLPSPGRTHTARRRIVADTWTALRDRGLAGPDGPDRGLVRLLRLLAASPCTVEVRAWGATSLRALAGRGSPAGSGVLARRQGEAVLLDRCASLAGGVVGLLPPAPAGPGRSATVPTAALAGALTAPAGAGLRPDLCAHGVAPDDAGLVARMLHGVRGRTELSVVAVDRWGLRRRAPDVLALLDGPRGRYLVTRDRGWTTVAPVDDRRLRARVADLVDDRAAAVRDTTGFVPLEAGPGSWRSRSQSRSPCRMSCRPDSVIEPDIDG